MDSYLEKAFEQANYATTLSNQKRVLLEEYLQDSVYFFNGSTFKVDRTLINFLKTLIDIGQKDTIIIDDNNIPTEIPNTQEFFDKVMNIYVTALNSYHTKYKKIKTSRTIESLLDL